jgi:hypothetical protein
LSKRKLSKKFIFMSDLTSEFEIERSDEPMVVSPTPYEDLERWRAEIIANDIDTLARDARAGGIAGDIVKKVAKHVGVAPLNQKKDDLIKAIRIKSINGEKLATAVAAKERKATMHDFPRMVNILFSFPNAVAFSQALRTRKELQFHEVNEKQEIFVHTATCFNDQTYNSGGNVAAGREDHYEHLKHIDPESALISRKVEAKDVFKLFHQKLKSYQTAMGYYDRSGRHNHCDFFNFCNEDTDLYYLHVALEKSPNAELNQFCSEGILLPSGIDSGRSNVFQTPAREIKRERSASTGEKDSGNKRQQLEALCESNKKKAQYLGDLAHAEQEKVAVSRELATSQLLTACLDRIANIRRQLKEVNEAEDYEQHEWLNDQLKLEMASCSELRSKKT